MNYIYSNDKGNTAKVSIFVRFKTNKIGFAIGGRKLSSKSFLFRSLLGSTLDQTITRKGVR